MAERNTPVSGDHQLPDCHNFEHGVVNSDAVYVPHSKPTAHRGHRGRGRWPGNYRHGQQRNDSRERSHYSRGTRPGARGRVKYGGELGQKPSEQHSQRYDRRDSPYEGRPVTDHGEDMLDGTNCDSSTNVAGQSASFAASADAYNGETELGTSSFHVRENVGNSRVPRTPRDDRRYEDHRYQGRSHRRAADQHPGRRGRNFFQRGSGSYRGSGNYIADQKFAAANVRDVSYQITGTTAAVARFEEVSDGTDHCDVREFSNSDHRNVGSEAQLNTKQLRDNGEKLPRKDDRYGIHKSQAESRRSDCIPDDQQFRDLHISAEMTNLPNSMPSNAHSRAGGIFNTKTKNTDSELETQRGYHLPDVSRVRL